MPAGEMKLRQVPVIPNVSNMSASRTPLAIFSSIYRNAAAHGSFRRQAWAIPLLLLLLATACRDPTGIGLDLLGEGDLLTAKTDTLTIRTYTIRGDSTVTSNLSDYLIGSDDDAVFGTTTAGLYTQFRLPQNNLAFTPDTGTSDNPVSYAFDPSQDSLILGLRLIGEYGNEDVAHSFRVFRLTEGIESGVNHYATTDFEKEATEIGRVDGYIVRPDDSIQVGEVQQPPQLRIRLSDMLASEFITRSINNDGTYVSDTSFQAFLPGLFIVPDTGAGFAEGFIRVDPDNAFSRLQLYYHATNNDTTRSGVINFVIGAGAMRTGRYTHNYSAGSVNPVACGTATPPEEDFTYISGLAGLRTKIEIPHLEDLGDIAINRALLSFPLSEDADLDSVFTAPPNAYVIRQDTVNCGNGFSFIIRTDELFLSVRDQFESGNHYDSRRRDITLPGGLRTSGYQLNVTREVQAILNGEVENNGFLLLPFPFFRTAHRAEIGSASNPDPGKRMQLEILYTEVE